MTASFSTSASALMPVDASSAQVRSLRHSNPGQRAALAQHVQQRLLQWQSEWGIEAAPIEVQCHAFTATIAQTVLAAQSWKPLSLGIPSETIWWTLLAPSSAATRPAGGRARPNGVVLLTALSQALFGESVNVQQEERAHPRTTYVPTGEQKGIEAALREEPLIHPESALAVDLVYAAWGDWCRHVRQLFGYLDDVSGAVQPADRSILADSDARTSDALPVEFLRNWSGTLYLSLPWCGNTLLLLLPSLLQERFQLNRMPEQPLAAVGAAPAGKLTPVWQALAAQTGTVEVSLAPLDIALGVLTSLQVGDVVRTSHALEEPLIVSLPPASGTVAGEGAAAGKLCEGYLGRQAGYRAVELL